MKYIVHVEHCNEKATNPCGHVNIKLCSPLPRQVWAKMLTTLLIKLLCFACAEFYHVLSNTFHIQWQTPAVSKQEEQKFSHTFSCSSIETCAVEYAGHWLFEQS